jgi:ubiquitin-like protein ATG12
LNEEAKATAPNTESPGNSIPPPRWKEVRRVKQKQMTVISTANDKKEDMKQNNNDIKNNNNQDKNNQDGGSNQKVKVHLVAVGSAPILKKNKFLMNRSDNFGVVISFLVKRLRLVTNASGSNTNTGGSNSTGGSNNDMGSNDNKTNNVSNNNTSSASSLFVYVNSAFVPSPTENIGDLYDCFGMKNNGELILHYSLQEAWG